MSGYDPILLSQIGIEETLYDFPLPTYARYQMVQATDDQGIVTFYSQPRPLSDVALIRLIFQIVDLDKFVR